MTTEQQRIKAVGHFLSNYESDLSYIQRFHDFIGGIEGFNGYVRATPHSFIGFLSEFKIVRNISKLRQDDLLREIKRWSKNDSPKDVDRLAERLKQKGYSFGKTPLSLCSKISFLVNPSVIVPLDQRGRDALSLRRGTYNEYFSAVEQFKKENGEIIKRCLDQVRGDAQLIEKNFKKLTGLRDIRQNRMVDKILWVKGGLS